MPATIAQRDCSGNDAHRRILQPGVAIFPGTGDDWDNTPTRACASLTGRCDPAWPSRAGAPPGAQARVDIARLCLEKLPHPFDPTVPGTLAGHKATLDVSCLPEPYRVINVKGSHCHVQILLPHRKRLCLRPEH